jgi:hypothetical protein
MAFPSTQFQELRDDLPDSKSNMLLMVAVANLAVAQRAGYERTIDENEEDGDVWGVGGREGE